jgi:hypothetical protein
MALAKQFRLFEVLRAGCASRFGDASIARGIDTFESNHRNFQVSNDLPMEASRHRNGE